MSGSGGSNIALVISIVAIAIAIAAIIAAFMLRGPDGLTTVVLAAPIPLLPPNGAEVNTVTPEFRWSSVMPDDFGTYTLVIDNDADFSSPEITKSGITGTKYKLDSSTPLTDFVDKYYWRVGATTSPILLDPTFVPEPIPPTENIDPLAPVGLMTHLLDLRIFFWDASAAVGTGTQGPFSDVSTFDKINRAKDYKIKEIGTDRSGKQILQAKIGLPPCVPSPDGECVSGIASQVGTSTEIDVVAGSVGAHFDSDWLVGEQLVCFFLPVSQTGELNDFQDTSNSVCEKWEIRKGDGTVLTLVPVDPVISTECDSLPSGVPFSVEETPCGGTSVTRTFSVRDGGSTIGTLEIVYRFTDMVKHYITFNTAQTAPTGTFEVIQSHRWDSSMAAETLLLNDGINDDNPNDDTVVEPTLTEVCGDDRLLAMLIWKFQDIVSTGALQQYSGQMRTPSLTDPDLADSIRTFITDVETAMVAGFLTSEDQGPLLIDGANNLIENVEDTTVDRCTIEPSLGGDMIKSISFRHGGQTIVSENLGADFQNLIEVTISPTRGEYVYGPFDISADAASFSIDPATNLYGVTGDGHVLSPSPAAGSNCSSSGSSKDTGNSVMFARSSDKNTTTACTRYYMQWDTSSLAQQPSDIDLTDLDISFSLSQSNSSRNCEYRSLVQSNTAPSSRTAGTLWGNIGGGTQYGSSQSCSTTSKDLGTTAESHLEGDFNSGVTWFAVGVKIYNDTTRTAGDEDAQDISSGDSGSKPVLTIVYTII
jgi:hypothetical protein